MTVREEQIALCHFMIDSMRHRRIALCDAGTGIGKTYAYLTAAVLFRSCCPSRGAQSITISTATVALQEAICREYLPFLSRVLLKNRVIDRPLYAAVRKGKERFVCDIRLAQRLEAVREKEKNENQLKALFSLRGKLDLDQLPELSGFDRRQICVPAHCPADCPGARSCRYHRYLWEVSRCESMIQICNHNYLLADAVHWLEGKRPLLNDFRLLIVDEAHRLPEAARQMCACSVSTTDLTELCNMVERELLPSSLALRSSVQELTRSLSESGQRSSCTAFLLTEERKEALQNTISLLRRLLAERRSLPFSLHYRLEETERLLSLFYRRDKHYVLTLRSHRDGFFQLQADIRDTPAQLRRLLWEQEIPAVLTSGTLMTGGSFERTRRSLGISCRWTETKAASPFPYQENCLLYFPANPTAARFGSGEEADWIAEQILYLVTAANGHTLVLFPSYSLMSAAAHRLRGRLSVPLMEVWRHAQDVIRQFKQCENAVLFASGSCWEGVDFPGDMVSSLILPRLPFSAPDPLSEAEREQYPTLEHYISEAVVPEMQRKLRQGFGRAIRTETDVCAVSILDRRACPGGRYHQAVLNALPECPVTRSVGEIEAFLRLKKGPEYFRQELPDKRDIRGLDRHFQSEATYQWK